jgi:hypothetical protein
MSDDRITTESVALTAVETDPIILRESDTRRLIFQPMIVDQPGAPVRGCFVWQRKRASDEWEEITGEALKNLGAGEGFKLELRSGEVTTLLQGILDATRDPARPARLLRWHKPARRGAQDPRRAEL